jgi:hypothetical protein
MKLPKHKNQVKLLLLLFFISNNIYSQENLRENIIREYFDDNQCSLYYFGIKHFYLGDLFRYAFINGNLEDRYTELFFIIPVDGNIGICIQGDQQSILDTFKFTYDPELGRFIRIEKNEMMSYVAHRSHVLNEITNIRFQIMTLDGVNSLLINYNIIIE